MVFTHLFFGGTDRKLMGCFVLDMWVEMWHFRAGITYVLPSFNFGRLELLTLKEWTPCYTNQDVYLFNSHTKDDGRFVSTIEIFVCSSVTRLIKFGNILDRFT